jgi:1-acyl-sn-glycerol-3-phosphate acyltransferase
MYLIIVSLLVWIFAIIIGAFMFPVAVFIWLVTYPFDKRLTLLHLFSSFWASTYTWMNPLWKTTIRGRKIIDPNKTYVMVCNHQSLLDILVLYRLFVHYKWVSKSELFKIPVMGWNMRINQYIAVDRASRKGHIHMLKQCEKTLQEGSSIMIFPEGTRSSDGTIHTFKDGAFKVAKTSKVDILPIILNGTSNSLPKSGFIMKNSQNIRIQVLNPIPYESFSNLSTKEIAERVHNYMNEHFEKLKTLPKS